MDKNKDVMMFIGFMWAVILFGFIMGGYPRTCKMVLVGR